MNMVSSVGVSVTSLLLKTLENATKEYARDCIRRCAEIYGFDSDEALLQLNLENCSIQVKEMKKRSVAKSQETKTKTLKEKVEKAVKVAVLKASCPFPFGTCAVSDEGCGGLAYNNGLFTQCQKEKMMNGSYCKGCQKEADVSASGCPATGTIAQRLSMKPEEFRCPKGRAPVPYWKVMQKLKLDRSAVELEAGKLNLNIDEMHFAVVEVAEKKEKAGRPKAAKKKVVTAETVEDLFAQLVDDDDDTVIMTESEEEEEEKEVDTRELEKSERNMMKSNEMETKKVMAQEDKKQKEAAKAAAKEQKIADELAAKEQKIADELAAKAAKEQNAILAKEQKIADELAAKAAKEQKAILAKEQKIADELAAKAAREQKLIDDKLAKEQKAIDDKLAKEQKVIDDLAAKAAAKEQKIADELAAKLAREQKLIDDKAAKEQKIADDKAAKEQKIADDKAAKEAARVAKEQKLAEDQAAKDLKKKQLEDAKSAKVVKKAPVVVAAPVAEPVAVAPKKVTVKRVTISGKEYLKTADNLLYNPDTKEEVGIYDELTNTIKDLPDDDDDEISEDGYDTN